MNFPKRAGPYKVRVSSAYGFWGPHLVLHGQMFMKSSEISQKNHQILRKITIQIPIKITNRNPYQSPFFVSSTVLPIPSEVTRLTLTSSGQERGAEDDEEDDGNRAADRRREVQEELERAWDLEISMGKVLPGGDWNHGNFSWWIYGESMVNNWLLYG